MPIITLGVIGGAITLLLGTLGSLWLRRTSDVTDIQIAPGVRMPLILNGITKDHGIWLALGGRGIDSAFLYGDEHQKQVGAAIAESGVPREEIFLVTKVNCCPTMRCSTFCRIPPFNNSAGPMAVHNASEMLLHSLSTLKQSYADLVLLHFPCTDFRDTLSMWEELIEARQRGWTRAIGVSNFNASLLQKLLKASKVKPAVVQNAFSVAGHPPTHLGTKGPCEEGSPLYGSDDATLALCRRKKIAFSAYSPLGSIAKVGVISQPSVARIADAHGKSRAQVALKWLTQQKIAAVTSTSRPKHVMEALDLGSFSLTKREMGELGAAV